jgi:hypothetical protein
MTRLLCFGKEFHHVSFQMGQEIGGAAALA